MDTIHLFACNTPMQNASLIADRLDKLGHEVGFTDGFTRPNVEQMLQSNNHFLVLAKQQQQILAFALFSRVLDEASLDYLAVIPSFQRKGVALSVLHYAIEQLHKASVDTIFLEVRQNNQAAISLYEKLGFQVIGIRPNYYHHPTQDALMMKYQS